MSMLPPPVTQFATRKELIDYVQNFANNNGYIITIKRSNKDSRVTLGCDRGGRYRNCVHLNKQEKRRNTSSRLVNCLFEIYAKKEKSEIWTFTVKNPNHNHETSTRMLGHPVCCRLNEENQ